MDRVFQIVSCSEENKVTFASHMLKGLTANRRILRNLGRFKPTFLDKYFPSTLRTHKEFEFQQLRQGNMSVTRYVENFKNMVVYSRGIKEVQVISIGLSFNLLTGSNLRMQDLSNLLIVKCVRSFIL